MPVSDKLLNYEISGQGPVIVLLHGYLSSLRYWDNLRMALAHDYTVITIDLLGFGESPKPKMVQYGYNDHISWIKRTLDHCGVDQPAIVMGHSMGALLALRFSSTYPLAIRQLVLMNMPLFQNLKQAHRELAGTSIVYKVGLYYGLHRLVWPLMRNTVSRVAMRKVMPAAFLGMETYMFRATAGARNGSLRNVIEGQRSFSELQRLNVATTLVIGLKDRLIYQKNMRHFVHTPHLGILLANTGHHTPIERPDLSLGLLNA
jgi:pimeloyl-ACP methyl ester carboxylesterase